tara:strand:+ start:430 stop:735 length:306 start_codon:yes stop_codon:yes gene_type:complete
MKIAPKKISQRLMKRYMELKDLADEFEKTKKEIVELAKKGLSCQPGPFSCHLETITTTSVSWKTEFIKVTSAEAAVELTDSYKGNSSRSTLSVMHRDQVTS